MYKFIFFLTFIIVSNFSYAQSQDTIDNALQKAKLENKRVFLNYSSSNKNNDELFQNMNNHEVKVLLDSDYVVVNITLSKLEINEIVSSYNATNTYNNDQISFPLWCILDDSGDILTTSFSN